MLLHGLKSECKIDWTQSSMIADAALVMVTASLAPLRVNPR